MEDWPIVAELLVSYDDNVKKVESLALREIFSIEVPVFNGLRDILPFSILTALRRMDYWFGKVPTIEHALCLVVLTDYVSCTYNQRNFYRTFENALTAKFVDSLFEKLYEEWRRVFSGRPLIHFTDSELVSVRKSLSRSVDRFPESFRHKFLLDHIVHLGKKYRKLLLKEDVGNAPISLPRILQPLGSKENVLSKYEDDPKNVVKPWQKKKINSDITKYVIRKPVQKESTNNVSVNNKATIIIPVATKKPVTDFSVAGDVNSKTRSSLEELKNNYEDDSTDSVDIYLSRKSILYSPGYSCDSGDVHSVTAPKSQSPIYSFYEEMKRLDECALEVYDSDEEKLKVNGDSNYSEISVEDECPKWGDISDSDEENMKVISDFNSETSEIKMDAYSKYSPLMLDEEKMEVNCDLNSKTNEVKIDEYSKYSPLMRSVEEKLDGKCDYLSETVEEKKLIDRDEFPKIVLEEDKKNVSCDFRKTITKEDEENVSCDLPKTIPRHDEKTASYDLPKTIIDGEKMNVANNNLCPASIIRKELVVSLCDCCSTEGKQTSAIPVPIVSAPKKKLNAFDILMKKVVPPKRKRFSK